MTDIIETAAQALDRSDYDQAAQLSRKALLYTDSPAARVILGRSLVAQGDILAAQEQFKSAVQSDPHYAGAWSHWSKLLEIAGHPERAEECLIDGLRYSPDNHALHNDLALLLLRRDKLDAADKHLRRAVEIDPASVISWFNLGALRRRQRDAAGAVVAYREVTRLNPSLPEGYGNLGDALKDSDYAAAEEALRTALRLRPDYPDALDNLGVILFLTGRVGEALAHFERALQIKPDFMRAFGHRTATLFILGDLERAWPLHRRRFDVAGIKVDPHGRFPNEVWNGQSLSGKSLLIWTEQGLGEEIMQSGMIPDALSRASKVTVECSPRLLTLLERSFPVVSFIPRVNPARVCPVRIDADYQIAGSDLGGVFRKTWQDFPKHSGYLVPDAEMVARLRHRYSRDGRRIVGLSWASNRSGTGPHKTMRLAEFAPLLRQPGIVFVNLQYDADHAEVAALAQAVGTELITDQDIDLLGDMDAVAAQIAAMDLVISVSNTAVHLAGALNVPVWNIIPGYNASGMWHWFSGQGVSPWYPSMKIYRRDEKNNASIIDALAHDLAAWVRSIDSLSSVP